MATEKHPNQNTNMPMARGAVDAARQRAAPQNSPYVSPPPQGKGSRRQIGPNEWIDDRVITFDQPASPSGGEPDEAPETRGTPPASYDPLKVYQIELGKTVVFAGRNLAPGKSYQMVGEACTTISAAIIDAVELGDIPV